MTAKTAVPTTLFSSADTEPDGAAKPDATPAVAAEGVVLEPAPVLTIADLPPLLDRQPPMLGPAYLWTITPEMSRYLIDRHDGIVSRYSEEARVRDGHNRAMRWRDVTTYGNDIVASRWARNGATISVTWDGLVSDGQHRLKACATTERPFESYVVFGVDILSQDTTDTGIKRKVHDQLNLRGEVNANNLAAIARWYFRWSRGARTRSGYAAPNPSELELIDFIESDERIRVATAWAVRSYGQFRQVRVTVYGLAWILFYAIDPASAEMFLDAVVTGANLGVNHPALTFRNRMIQAYVGREKLNEHHQLALMIMAWNAFRADRTISKLPLPSGGLKPSNFPEPR